MAAGHDDLDVDPAPNRLDEGVSDLLVRQEVGVFDVNALLGRFDRDVIEHLGERRRVAP